MWKPDSPDKPLPEELVVTASLRDPAMTAFEAIEQILVRRHLRPRLRSRNAIIGQAILAYYDKLVAEEAAELVAKP